MRIKICGITRRQDAELAIDCGASALGFVFWPKSPRAVTIEQVRPITHALPPFVSAVGVFVNQPMDEVREIVEQCRLTAIQLHGDEAAATYRNCAAHVIRAIPVGPGFTLAAVDGVPAGMTALLDAHDPVRRGGTGRPIDWSVAAAAARMRRVILSGGLTPDNVQRAVDVVQPFAVDVSSGVESAPGIKDESRLRAFFAALMHESSVQHDS
jgi:phosphoribosylanthranilate isomerase